MSVEQCYLYNFNNRLLLRCRSIENINSNIRMLFVLFQRQAKKLWFPFNFSYYATQSRPSSLCRVLLLVCVCVWAWAIALDVQLDYSDRSEQQTNNALSRRVFIQHSTAREYVTINAAGETTILDLISASRKLLFLPHWDSRRMIMWYAVHICIDSSNLCICNINIV